MVTLLICNIEIKKNVDLRLINVIGSTSSHAHCLIVKATVS